MDAPIEYGGSLLPNLYEMREGIEALHKALSAATSVEGLGPPGFKLLFPAFPRIEAVANPDGSLHFHFLEPYPRVKALGAISFPIPRIEVSPYRLRVVVTGGPDIVLSVSS